MHWTIISSDNVTILISALKQIHWETAREWKSKLDDITEKYFHLEEQVASSSKSRCEQCAGLLEQNRILVEDFKNLTKKNNDTFEHMEKTLQFVMCRSNRKENKEEGMNHQKVIRKTGSQLCKDLGIGYSNSTVVSPQSKEYSKKSKLLHNRHASLSRNRKFAISTDDTTEDRGMSLDPGLSGVMLEAPGLNSGEDEEIGNCDIKIKTEFPTESNVKMDEERSHDDGQTLFSCESDNDKDKEICSTDRNDQDSSFVKLQEQGQNIHDNGSVDSKYGQLQCAGGISASFGTSYWDKHRTRMGHAFDEHLMSPPTPTDKKDMNQQEDRSQSTCESILFEKLSQQEEQFTVSGGQQQDSQDSQDDASVKHNFTDFLNTQWQILSQKCDICGEEFALSDMLHKHKQLHIKRRQHKCDVCGKGFVTPSELNKHKSWMHTGEKPHKCDVCGKEFDHPMFLYEHKQTHPEDRQHKCDICGKGFKLSRKLHEHKETHMAPGDGTYKCDVCGKGFSVIRTLVAHKLTHLAEQPYTCDICGKGFRNGSYLRTHLGRTLCGKKQYKFKCDVCGIGITNASYLHQHKMIHTGEKPNVCDVCGRGFCHPSSLVAHKLTHSIEKPHKCEVCGRGFHLARKLRDHKEVHKPPEERTHKCDVCGKGFGVYWTLLTHKRTHTGEEPYICDVCGKGFRYGGSLKSHLQTHGEGKGRGKKGDPKC